jgi:threonine dehydratase
MTVTTKAQASHIGLEEIEAAREVLKGQVVRTPTIAAPKLSALTGAEVYVKCESLQFTGSFKDRGAFVKLASLSDSEARRGVIAMSAGNHAQAVAYHASRLGIPATIVMPEHTPFVKVANTEAFGAEVVLSGRGLYEAQARAVEIAEERGLVIVHPYDDPRIIAGQGTIALEVLHDVPDLDVIVVPIGGGA